MTPTPEPSALDVDGDGVPLPLNDAVLVLRWLFGFRGDQLIAGAVGQSCSRCNADEIEDYLESVSGSLDIDDNGIRNPLTDGVLLLRWLLGFTGSSLTTGAIGVGCERCTAGAIDEYLLGL